MELNEILGSRLGLLSNLFIFFKIIPKITNFIKSNKIEIVHSNSIRENLTYSLICKILNKKHVWHQRSVLKAKKLKFIFQYFSNVIISNSKFTSDNLPYHAQKK